MNKYLKKLQSLAEKHPRRMAILFAPYVLLWVPVTIFILYPIGVFEHGFLNRKWVWEETYERVVGALNTWSYALVKNERGEW